MSKSATTDGDGDRHECSIFGELVACKMRKLDEQARGEVEMAINSALFEQSCRSNQRSSATFTSPSIDIYLASITL